MEYTDKELLDWMQSQTKGYGNGWIFRNSKTGRGMRLHETYDSGKEVNRDVRKAISAHIEATKAARKNCVVILNKQSGKSFQILSEESCPVYFINDETCAVINEYIRLCDGADEFDATYSCLRPVGYNANDLVSFRVRIIGSLLQLSLFVDLRTNIVYFNVDKWKTLRNGLMNNSQKEYVVETVPADTP